MKLAEALNLRGDIQTRITQLKNRLIINAKVQEGDTPSEDPEELLRELDRLVNELEALISQINLTNSVVTYKGKTLTELLARRDALTVKSSVLRSFLSSASQRTDSVSHKEIRILSTVDVARMRKKTDALSEELRLINIKIQELNWTNDLIE